MFFFHDIFIIKVLLPQNEYIIQEVNRQLRKTNLQQT